MHVGFTVINNFGIKGQCLCHTCIDNFLINRKWQFSTENFFRHTFFDKASTQGKDTLF